MFKCSITEGWLDIMIWGAGARGTPWNEKVIVPNYNPIWQLYFCAFIIMGAFFLLNLFDGIVIDNYNSEKQKSLGINDMNKGQRTWT